MTQLTISTYFDACGDNAGDYYDTDTKLYFGHDTGVGNTHLQTGWLGFVLDLPQGKQIASARLYFYATQNRSDSLTVKLGCEAVDDADEPVSAATITAKTLTTAYTLMHPSGYTDGVQYSEDVTAAVQEILNRPGWVPNAVLAVLYKSQSTGATDDRRLFASLENTSYTEPQLVITYDGYVPQALGVI